MALGSICTIKEQQALEKPRLQHLSACGPEASYLAVSQAMRKDTVLIARSRHAVGAKDASSARPSHSYTLHA